MKLSINKRLVNKNELNDKQAFSQGFENVDLTPDELAKAINQGFAFCAQLKPGRARRTENFLCSDIIAVDIDDGWTIQEAVNDEFIINHATILYTTPSHSKANHRFRIIFRLPRTITDPEEMRQACTGISTKLKGDPRTVDPCRIFFGSKGRNPVILDENRLTEEQLDELIRLGQSPRHLSDNVSTSSSGNAISRSGVGLAPDTMVRCADGTNHPVESLPPRVSVHCPIHRDRKPSAFTVRSRSGNPGVHCSSCRQTFWLATKHRHPYDFFEFDRVVRELRQANEPEPWERYFEAEELNAESDSHVISERYLDGVPFQPGITLIKSPKGTGKTRYLEKVIEKCRRQRLSVLLIGHRVALLQANAKRLGLRFYQEEHANHGSSYAPISDHYAICVDSMATLLQPNEHKFDVIILDESEQVFSHLAAESLGDRRRKCFLLIKHYIAKARSVLALDADLNRITLSALTSFDYSNKDVPIFPFLNKYKLDGEKLHLYVSENHLFAELIDAIKSGKRCYVSSNSMTKIEELAEKIANDFGDRVRYQVITSKTSQTDAVRHFIANIKTEILTYDVVLASPSLGTGIDITFNEEAKAIDCVFGFFEARINTHFDIDQQLSRVRHPGEIRVWISPETFQFETETEPIKFELAESNAIPEAFKGFNLTDGSPQYDLDDAFLNLYAEIVAAQRASKNHLRANFVALRERNGWEVINVARDDTLSAQGKELKADAKTIRRERYIAALLDATPLDQSEYDELAYASQRGKTLATTDQYRLQRAEVERFYNQPVTRKLLVLDDEGWYRKKIRLLELVLSNTTVEMASITSALSVDRLSTDTEETKASMLREIFNVAGVFDMRAFTADKVISHSDLAEFTAYCRQNKTRIERVFNKDIRSDIARKPMAQLGWFLSAVGLQTEKCGAQRNGSAKTYLYWIDPGLYATAMETIRLRKMRGGEGVDDELVAVSQPHKAP